MYKYTIELEKKEDRHVLTSAAERFGLFAKRGAGAGIIGSAGRLMRGIVRGDFTIVETEEWNRLKNVQHVGK